MSTEAPQNDIEDDICLAGKACGWTPVGESEVRQGFVKGSRREPENRARIIIEVTEDGEKRLVDADRRRVEVF